MANTRISDLTASASNLASTDLAPVVQTVGVGPVKMTGLQLAGGLLGSTTFNGSTVTTSSPVLNLTQTWNAGAVTFTGLKFNATDTASASGSLLLDLQVGTKSYWGFQNKDTGGNNTPTIAFGNSSAYQFTLRTTTSGFILSRNDSNADYFQFKTSLSDTLICAGTIGWAASIGATTDLRLTRAAAATLQLGAADAAAPVAQTFKVQGVVAGTTNTAGANFTIQGSQGTGTGAGGSIIFQVAPAGSSGTAQNAYATALTIASDGNCSFAGNLYGVSGVYKGASGTANNGISFNYSGGSDAVLWGTTGGKYARIGSGQLTVVSGASIGWSSSSTNAADTAADVSLFRDAANTLALKNSTNPQIFRAYSTTTGPSYGYFASGVTDAGVATADTLFIGTGGAGAAMTKLALVVNGTTRLNLSDTTAAFTADITATGYVKADGANGFWAGASSYIFWNGRVQFSSPAANVLLIEAASGDLITRLGGSTSSFPALKRSSATLQVRLADDSAYAPVEASTVRTATAYTVATLPAAGTAGRRAYVTDATAPTYLGALIGGGTVVCPVFDNGTAWVSA